MSKIHSKGKVTDPINESKVNSAKAAFEEYKKKMGTSYRDPVVGNKEIKPEPPFGSPYMYNIPPHSFPHLMPGMPYPPFPKHPYVGQPPFLKASEGSLFENLGNMMRLGVDFINSTLAGGVQMLGEFSGRGFDCSCSHHGYRGDACCNQQSNCCYDQSVCCHGYGDCCRETNGDSCCTPSVHGCC